MNVYQTAWLLNRFALGTPLAEVAGGLSRDTFEKAKDDVSTSKDSKPKASEVRFNNENGMGGGVSDANHDAIVKGTTLPVKTITLTSMDIVGEDMIPLNCKMYPITPTSQKMKDVTTMRKPMRGTKSKQKSTLMLKKESRKVIETRAWIQSPPRAKEGPQNHL